MQLRLAMCLVALATSRRPSLGVPTPTLEPLHSSHAAAPPTLCRLRGGGAEPELTLRLRTADGTRRLALPAGATVAQLRAAVHSALSLPMDKCRLDRAPGGTQPIDAADDTTLESLGLARGAPVFRLGHSLGAKLLVMGSLTSTAATSLCARTASPRAATCTACRARACRGAASPRGAARGGGASRRNLSKK